MDGKVGRPKTRFAPTPSGYLHQGNLYSFMLTWLIAKRSGGSILLRIDDLDQNRVRQEYIEDIFYTIDWLGLDYDYGPSGPDDFRKNFSQLNRLELYQEALKKLQKKDHELFYCKCSRKEVMTDSADGSYPGTCLLLNLGPQEGSHVLRLQTDNCCVSFYDHYEQKEHSIDLGESIPYPVIWKKDDLPSYQLASVIDDINYEINTIVRGSDLLFSSALQIHLSRLLPRNQFSQSSFYHHALLSTKREKMSKSQEPDRVLPKTKTQKNQLIKEFSVWLGVQETDQLEDLL